MKTILLSLLISSQIYAADNIADASRPSQLGIAFNCKFSLSNSIFQDFTMSLTAANSDCPDCYLNVIAEGESTVIVNGRHHIIAIQLFETHQKNPQSLIRRYATFSVTKLLASAADRATPESIDSRNFEVISFDNVNGSLRIPSTRGILSCKRF